MHANFYTKKHLRESATFHNAFPICDLKKIIRR